MSSRRPTLQLALAIRRASAHIASSAFGFIAGLRGRAMAQHSLAQIGVNTGAEASNARAEVGVQAGEPVARGDRGDHFVERNGRRCAGSHLLIDLWDGQGFDDIRVIDSALRRAVQAAGATLLHLHLHEFGSGGGVSGVAVLAESHISIHTWPEHGYAAIDAFMCGAADPHKVVPILRRAFNARRIAIFEQMRGVL
jgi:S-adenosylmethionine decarboxylase